MDNNDAIAIPEGILGSWSYTKDIFVSLKINAFIDYAPGEMYDILNMTNPYEENTDHKLLLYYLRVTAMGVATTNDTFWLGPFCAKVIAGDKDGDYKLSIISKFPDEEPPLTKHGWTIIPPHPIDPSGKGFNTNDQMEIIFGVKLDYHDIYNNRFINATYNDDGKLTLVITILCKNGKCPSPTFTHKWQVEDKDENGNGTGKYHLEIKGSAEKGCGYNIPMGDNDFINDCLPSNKFENNASCICPSCNPHSTTLYKVSIGILLVILVILLLVKIFKKKS